MRDFDTWRKISIAYKPTIISYSKSEKFPYGIANVLRLYCAPGYPAQTEGIFKNIELRWYGFSDHTIGIDAARIALARGAQIIEKHFVLYFDKDFPDNSWSMTPDDLKELVRWEGVCQSVLQ